MTGIVQLKAAESRFDAFGEGGQIARFVGPGISSLMGAAVFYALSPVDWRAKAGL